jgi:hypothetical protein
MQTRIDGIPPPALPGPGDDSINQNFGELQSTMHVRPPDSNLSKAPGPQHPKNGSGLGNALKSRTEPPVDVNISPSPDLRIWISEGLKIASSSRLENHHNHNHKHLVG